MLELPGNEEKKDEENLAGRVLEGSGRRRSKNSITLTTGSKSGIVSRAGQLLYRLESQEGIEADHESGRNRKHSSEKSPVATPRGSDVSQKIVTQLVDEARISLNEVVDDAKASLEELTQTVLMRRERKYRRSLRWYGSAANISNETMVPASFIDTIAIDEARCTLLDSSRRLNPVDLVWRIDLAFTASILPRVVRNSVSVLVFAAYAATALCKRLAYLGGRKGDQEDNTVVKLSIFVSFIIVFYSNHCYTRFYRQFESVKLCCLAVTDLATVARSMSVIRPSFSTPTINPDSTIHRNQSNRTSEHNSAYPPKPMGGGADSSSFHSDRDDTYSENTFIPEDEHLEVSDQPSKKQQGRLSLDTIHRLWRYLNAAHAAGYTGLSPTYTRTNLFEPFVTHYKLLTQSEINTLRNEHVDVEDPSGAYFHELVCWALSLVAEAREAGEISSPNETVAVQEIILKFRSAMQSLFDERFQEIPFAYSHLVSFICTAYLFVLSIDMGLKFGRKEPIAAGLIFPALAVFFTTVVLLGLLYLGKAMSQPTGLDPEAFPIYSYLESTCLASRRLVRPPRSSRDSSGDKRSGTTSKPSSEQRRSFDDSSDNGCASTTTEKLFSQPPKVQFYNSTRSSSISTNNPVVSTAASAQI